MTPYQTVLTSIVAAIVLFSGILVYRYFYPKRPISYSVLVFLLSLLPLVSLLRSGVYESGDFTIHIYEAMSFYENIREGELIPRWGGGLNATYGYPVFVFAYPLPNYLTILFHMLGFSFVVSLKLFLAFAFISSGLTMYWFMKNYTGKLAGFVSSLFYLFAPYHLVALHYRVAIGEMLSFVFLPLNLLAAITIIKKTSYHWFLASAVCFACLILSHQAVSLAFFPLLIAFSLFSWKVNKRKTRNLIFYFMSLFLGLGLSAFYWIPVLYEKQFTLLGLFPSSVSFNNFSEFFFTPWRYGFLFQGPEGQLSVIIGYVQWIVIFLTVYFLFFKKLRRSIRTNLLFFAALFAMFFYLMQSVSAPLWNSLPLLNNFQFSYRLLSLIMLITSVIAGILTKVLDKKVLLIFCGLAIFLTILNWGNRRVIPEITDKTLRNNLPYSTYQGEGNGQSAPKWAPKETVWMRDIPQHHLEIISGSAQIKELSRTNTYHAYVLNVAENSTFKENTLYFPGWQLRSNDKNLEINYTHENYPGIITFSLSKGLHFLTLAYELTFIQVVGRIISVVSLGVSILFLVFGWRNTKKI